MRRADRLFRLVQVLRARRFATARNLAEALEVSVASMTGIVDRMEKRSLVERRRGGEDRRVVLVYPTEAGRDVFRDIDRRRREGLARIIERLSDEELAGLLKGHRALREARAAIVERALATGTPQVASPAQTTTPHLHAPSTISLDDGAMKPTGRRE